MLCVASGVGGTKLEDSLALWERGEKLTRICQCWLDGDKQRLDAAIAVLS